MLKPTQKEIILGTVQFGLDYGITNNNGKVPITIADKILRYAISSGINTVDTSEVYGNSEEILSKFSSLNVITKFSFPSFDKADDIIGCIEDKLLRSLNRLRRISIHCLMIHNTEQNSLDVNLKILDYLQSIKSKGIIKKIGISVYYPETLLELLESCVVDIVQIPINIFDQRFCVPDSQNLFFKHGVEVHARSLFLQGSLLSQKTPAALSRWDHLFRQFQKVCFESNLSPIQACIAYPCNLDFVTALVVGVTSQSQLKEIIQATTSHRVLEGVSAFSTTDLNLINPSKWQN